MKRGIVLPILLIITGFLLLRTQSCPCRQPTTTWPLYGESTQDQTLAHNPLVLRISLEKSCFKLGEEITINLTLVNKGDKNVTLNFPVGPLYLNFMVTDNNDRFIYKSHPGSFQMVGELTLEPEEE